MFQKQYLLWQANEQKYVEFYDVISFLFDQCNARKEDTRSQDAGIPWVSSGQDLAPPLLEAQVQSLVGELRPHKPHGIPPPQKKDPFAHSHIHLPNTLEHLQAPSTVCTAGSRMISRVDKQSQQSRRIEIQYEGFNTYMMNS